MTGVSYDSEVSLIAFAIFATGGPTTNETSSTVTAVIYAFTASVTSPFVSYVFNTTSFPSIPPFSLISSTAACAPFCTEIPSPDVLPVISWRHPITISSPDVSFPPPLSSFVSPESLPHAANENVIAIVIRIANNFFFILLLLFTTLSTQFYLQTFAYKHKKNITYIFVFFVYLNIILYAFYCQY